MAHKTDVYAPVPEARAKKDERGHEFEPDKYTPKPDDSEALAKWPRFQNRVRQAQVLPASSSRNGATGRRLS